MKIVVIGGTGLIGSKLVDKLREDGHDAVAASPGTGVDTVSGKGLAEALQGAEVVVDVSNAPAWDNAAVLRFFQTSSRNLLAAEAAVGVRHHVALSVVGADRLPDSGYFRAKVAQEEVIKTAPIPYTILRATQFFEFMGRIADSSSDDNTVRLSPALVRPVAADDVAVALADVAEGTPVNGTVELAGPEALALDELARRVLSAHSDARRVIADVHARYFGAELGDESLTPGDAPRIARPALRTGSATSRPHAARPLADADDRPGRRGHPDNHNHGDQPMHDIRVSVTRPEAADHGVAEFWAAGELIGFTLLEDSDLMLRIEPRLDGTAVVVGAHSLAQALVRANRLLESPGPSLHK